MEEIKVPDKAVETIRRLFLERQALEAKIGNYLQGLIDSFGLEGDNWSLDTNDMVFRQLEESPNGRAHDAVGAVTGDSEGESYHQ